MPLTDDRGRRRRGFGAASAFVVALLTSGACSDSGNDAASTTATAAATAATGSAPAAGGAPLRVDLIDDAIAAVEQELGGPQEYYEINATPALVNLFVAGDGTSVTAYVYVGGVLTSQPVGEADGATFRAEALELDPDLVTSRVTRELSTSRQDAFEILGGPEGTVLYSIIVTSAAGGQLIVQVSGDGTIGAVDPV